MDHPQPSPDDQPSEHVPDTGDVMDPDAPDPRPVEVTDPDDPDFVEPYPQARAIDPDQLTDAPPAVQP